MKTYLLVHAIQSPLKIQELENYLSENFQLKHDESETGWVTYEIQTNLLKEDFIKALRSFILGLSLKMEERVVIYDSDMNDDFFKVPSENEKIILNGDVEKEYSKEKIMIELFEHIKMKMNLKKE